MQSLLNQTFARNYFDRSQKTLAPNFHFYASLEILPSLMEMLVIHLI